MEKELDMVLAFLPVRGGSKSIPLKNIKSFCGRPLLYWSLRALEFADGIDEVVVATDSDAIEKVAEGFGFSKVKIYRRDPKNAVDSASTESVMLEYLSYRELDNDVLFMLVQATSPLTQSIHFQQAADFMKQLQYDGGGSKNKSENKSENKSNRRSENQNVFLESEKSDSRSYDSLLSCVRTKRFFWNDDGTPNNYDYRSRPLRQNFSGLLMENGSFYINRVGNIKRDKNRLSGRIAVYEMPEFTAVEIDEEDDWLIAEKLMRKHVFSGISENTAISESAGKRERELSISAEISDKKSDKISEERSKGTCKELDIQLFLSDVDGTLTDAGMYYDENGNELKKFNTHDGKGFQLLREQGIKTGILTSEVTGIVERRAEKLGIDFLVQGITNNGKLQAAEEICTELGLDLNQVAYIGDDVNCIELLEAVGLAACPKDAVAAVKSIPGIRITEACGGKGAVREIIDTCILGAYPV